MTELTFKAALAAQQETLIKSNLANLASAHVGLQERIVSLQNDISAMKVLQAEIETMGERDPASLHVSEIKELYNRCEGKRNRY